MTAELVLLPRVASRGREVTGARLQALLALLAGELRRGRGTDRLVDELWAGDEQPENPTKALQVLVSRARAQLGGEVVVRTPAGYRLALDEEQVDAAAVLLREAEAGRALAAGDAAAALERADAGLALFDGAAPAAGGGGPLAELRAARLPAYRSLRRARALALARLGRPEEALPALEEAAAGRDEEVLAELLRALAATAGPAAALDRYEAYRRELRDELGTDPGPALRALFGELLVAAAPAVRHGVAEEPNELLGRDADLDAVAALLRTSRVVSVTGPGGLGKTRLAHAVARGAPQRVVSFVGLAAVSRDEDVTAEVASQLGVESRRFGSDLVLGILDALTPGAALLVLDNCEQVVAGAAALVRELVARSAELRVLTTTRAPLGLSSESVYPLPELDPPTAVALFRARAAAARPDVDLPPGAVEEVCRHLDGLPLAVELAAARVRVMSVAEISRALRDRFALLRGGPRDAPERHRTLLAVVDWSWNLLDEDGRSALRCLSVFPAGFSAAGASHVLGADAHPVLEDLVEQSLLKVADTAAGTRFAMLESVRELGAARLAEAGGTADAVGRFLAWARDFGVEHALLPFGPEPAAPVERMRAEQENLGQALRYAVERRDAATVAALTAVLGSLWNVESNYVGVTTLRGEPEWLLSHYRPEPAMVETTRLAAALNVAFDFVIDRPRATRSLAVLRRLPPAPPGTLTGALSELLTAPPGSLDALAGGDDPVLAGLALAMRGYVRESAGDLAGAAADAERVLASFGRTGTPVLRVIAHTRVGELHMHADRGAEALEQFRAAMRVPGLPRNFPEVLGVRPAMVLASLQAGELDEAQAWVDSDAGPAADTFGSRSFDLAVRAELLLARGDVDAGLAFWRGALEPAAGELPGIALEPGLEPWTLEMATAAVVAHARAGRVELVGDAVARLEEALPRLLSDGGHSPVLYAGMPLCGAILLALGMADVARGDAKGGVRLVALAQRFSYIRQFGPTLSEARVRADAERADGPAYAEAVSAYAGLPAGQLRAAALAALRDRVTASG